MSYLAETVVLNADELYYRQVFGEVIRALQGVSDRVEWGELGTAYVRIDGMEALYGGEEQVVQALLEAVPADLTARIGVADAKFPAFVAARMREPGCRGRRRMCGGSWRRIRWSCCRWRRM